MLLQRKLVFSNCIEQRLKLKYTSILQVHKQYQKYIEFRQFVFRARNPWRKNPCNPHIPNFYPNYLDIKLSIPAQKQFIYSPAFSLFRRLNRKLPRFHPSEFSNPLHRQRYPLSFGVPNFAVKFPVSSTRHDSGKNWAESEPRNDQMHFGFVWKFQQTDFERTSHADNSQTGQSNCQSGHQYFTEQSQEPAELNRREYFPEFESAVDEGSQSARKESDYVRISVGNIPNLYQLQFAG